MESLENMHIEAQPLLVDEECQSVDGEECHVDGTIVKNHDWARSITPSCGLRAQKRRTILVVLSLLMFTLTFSGMLFLLPCFRLVEDAVCHAHYGKDPSEPIDEKDCKVDEVQKQLASLTGWSFLITSMVTVTAALPYGVLADRHVLPQPLILLREILHANWKTESAVDQCFCSPTLAC